ncbi:DNA photolyase, FAD-binding/Cryptochrome [Pilaira anomala]|nr:DNA photolyase, FAD-binding/Cryptochrome [Pilaira anomala]
MVDISLLNKQLNQDHKTPKTWYFQLERCANFRTRFYLECILSLKKELTNKKSDLLILFGKPEDLFPQLQRHLLKNQFKLDQIHTHKEVHKKKKYAFEEIEVEKALGLKDLPIMYHHDTTMVHPDDLDFAFEKTYKVYTHFRKRIEKMDQPVRAPLDIPDQLPPFPSSVWDFNQSKQQDHHLSLLYQDSSVKKDHRDAFPWEGGEASAKERLNQYLFKSDGVIDYKHTRNGLIGTEYSTKFSVYLAHGCLSPRLIWHEMDRFEREQPQKRQIKAMGDDDGVYWVKFELLWRDFFRFLVAGYGKKVFMLHGFRDMSNNKSIDPDAKKPKNSYLDKVWKSNHDYFTKWKNGQTGSPFIDACMRELLYTGFMNNRGRQNVASYLAKDLEIDWRIGAEYFESMLKDHDVYSNYGNWQYGKVTKKKKKKKKKKHWYVVL